MCGADLPGKLTLPVTTTGAALDGLNFGIECAALDREAFEQALQAQLNLIEAILEKDNQAEEALAAFDQAAWDAWEFSDDVQALPELANSSHAEPA